MGFFFCSCFKYRYFKKWTVLRNRILSFDLSIFFNNVASFLSRWHVSLNFELVLWKELYVRCHDGRLRNFAASVLMTTKCLISSSSSKHSGSSARGLKQQCSKFIIKRLQGSGGVAVSIWWGVLKLGYGFALNIKGL